MQVNNTQPSLNEMYNGITNIAYYEDGTVSGLRFNEQNVVLTHAGQLIPYFSEDSPRRKYKASITFQRDGAVKSISLDSQQEIMTPIGDMPAEFVTFYDTGELKRVFPLDGKISGFWSEDDEKSLNIPLSFEFEFATFTAMLSGICFYKSGNIRSVTLYPKEIIKISLGSTATINTRQGFSLYEDGTLQSLEPDEPIKIETPIGMLTAYDPNANGVNADKNSLQLDEQGNITSLITPGDRIHAFRKSDGASYTFLPKIFYTEDKAAEILPLKVEFDHNNKTVTIIDAEGTPNSFEFSDTFVIYNDAVSNLGCSPSDCANCSLCGK